RQRASKAQDYILQTWSLFVAWLFTIKIRVEGQQNYSENGVLFLFNHSSHFDIPLFYASVRKPSTRFGAKIELFKVPFLSGVMKRSGVLPIARHRREEVMQLYSDSIARVYAGESFVLAAEGTRQPTPGVGANFKSGPLVFAIQGQFEIQPVVIRGAYDILPKTQLFPSWGKWINPVRVSILPPVSTKGLTLDQRDQLKASLHAMMTAEYNRLTLK
ncbi:MAG: lysophospholipid acyltransferase family protein, partial [Bdellovibrionota bacterium]